MNQRGKGARQRSNDSKLDFNFKAKFVPTMLNITNTCGAGQQLNESLKVLLCMLLFKTPVSIPFKTFTDDIKMLVVSTKQIHMCLVLNILYLNVIANEQ